MLNGQLRTLNYALGVIRLWREVKVVTLWLVCVERVFAICAVSLGSLITKITSNAIYLRKEMMMKLVEKKQFYKN